MWQSHVFLQHMLRQCYRASGNKVWSRVLLVLPVSVGEPRSSAGESPRCLTKKGLGGALSVVRRFGGLAQSGRCNSRVWPGRRARHYRTRRRNPRSTGGTAGRTARNARCWCGKGDEPRWRGRFEFPPRAHHAVFFRPFGPSLELLATFSSCALFVTVVFAMVWLLNSFPLQRLWTLTVESTRHTIRWTKRAVRAWRAVVWLFLLAAVWWLLWWYTAEPRSSEGTAAHGASFKRGMGNQRWSGETL